MTRWIRQLVRRTPTAPVSPPKFARLGVHPLEDRLTPSVVASTPDPLFNDDGLASYNQSTYNDDDDGRAVAVQADGKVVVAGSLRRGTGNSIWGVWRYKQDGTLDNTFDGNGIRLVTFSEDGGTTLDHRATAVAIQPDGKIVVGGYSQTATTGYDQTVVRLNSNGTPDSTFSTGGIWTRPTRLSGDDKGHALALQPDGKIVLAGYATFAGSGADFMVTRLTTAGGVDWERSVAFDRGGIDYDEANGVAVQGDGKIVVVGGASNSNVVTGFDMAVARLNASGTLDTSFDGDGKLTVRFDPGTYIDLANDVAVQPDGKLVIVGTVETATSGEQDFGVVRLNANGSFDTTFSGDGLHTLAVSTGHDDATAVALQPDGKIVVGGGNASNAAVARFNSNGTFDSTFDSNGYRLYAFNLGGTNVDRLNDLALDSFGRIVGVGSAATAANGTDLALLRVYGGGVPLVVDAASDVVDGNPAAGQLSLREAIALANARSDADTITFADGLNGGTITLAGTRLEVRQPLTISGPSRGLTLDGNLQSQVLYFDGRTNGTYAATLKNLTITRGMTGANEEVHDGIDSGRYGGGITNNQTNLKLDTVTVSNSQAGPYLGGGIFNWVGANSKLTVTNSLIVGNSADGGGGILNSGGTLTISNSTISGNTAHDWGGGLYVEGGVVTLTNVTATLNRCDFDDDGIGAGGFLYTVTPAVTAHNSVIAGNRITDTILDEIYGTIASASSNNIVGHFVTTGGLTNGVNGNQVGVDPLLGVLKDNGGPTKTHAPALNSSAIGKASSAVAGYSVYDQRGAARDVGTPDLGAYEVQHPLTPVGVPATLPDLFTPKPSASADEAYIKGLYRTTLLREATAADVAAWLPYMAQGRAFVANGFVNSVENRDNQVRFLFRYILNRESDFAGIAYWRDRLRGGTPETEVIRGFILSPEFTAGNNNTQFVLVMYSTVLGRLADAAGFTTWVNLLDGGMPRGQASDAFLRSPEGIRRVVKSLFQTYLKRAVDDSTADAFRGVSFGQAAVIILSSQEFYNNAGSFGGSVG